MKHFYSKMSKNLDNIKKSLLSQTPESPDLNAGVPDNSANPAAGEESFVPSPVHSKKELTATLSRPQPEPAPALAPQKEAIKPVVKHIFPQEGRTLSGKQLEELYIWEKKIYDDLEEAANHFGNEKRLYILKKREEALSKKNRFPNWNPAVDTWFGFIEPSGETFLAPPVSNEATAHIREENEANLKFAFPNNLLVTEDKNSDNWDRVITEMDFITHNDFLIDSKSSQYIFDHYIEVTNATVDVSQTGNIKVTATVTGNQGLYYIDGDAYSPAFVDGTILAHIFDGDQEIATAKLVLPYPGLSREKSGLAGIAMARASKNKQYSVTFSPYKLWLIQPSLLS